MFLLEKIARFFVAIIIQIALVYFLKKINENIKLKNNLMRYIFNYFIVTIFSVFSIFSTITILTGMYLFDYLISLLTIYIVSFLFLLSIIWHIDALNSEGISRMECKEQLINQLVSSQKSYLLPLSNRLKKAINIIGLLLYTYIYFFMSIPIDATAKYIIAVSFITGSFVLISTLICQPIFLSKPEIDYELRMDFLAGASYILLILSFFIYIILWALDISIFKTIIIIKGFEINLLPFILLFILMLFLILIVIPYSFGEMRFNKNERKFMEKRIDLIMQIEKNVDLTNLDETKRSLKVLNEQILDKLKLMNDELSSKKSNLKIDNLCIKYYNSFSKEITSHIDALRRYSEQITFTINEGSPQAFFELDKQTNYWIDSTKEELDKVNDRKLFIRKSISLIGVILATLSTLMGIPFTEILNSLK